MTERLLAECPKCGARNGCDKHGLSATGIDYRVRYTRRSTGDGTCLTQEQAQ